MKRPFVSMLGCAALALVAAVVVLLSMHSESAQAAVDISGDWNIQTAGTLEISCSATIVQTETNLSMQLDCPAIGTASLTGTIDQETGTFSASGTILIFSLTIDGTADADSISGNWSSDVGLSGTFTALRVGVTPTPTPVTPLPTLSSPLDVTGTWRVTFSGIFSGSCDSFIQQTESDLRAAAECDVIGPLELGGLIDPNTGAIFLTSSLVTLDGVASETTVSGTWDALGLLQGTFTGTRVSDIPLVDLTGDWRIAFQGDSSDMCALAIVHDDFDASGHIDCGAAGSTDLTGSANPLSGSFALNGTLGEDVFRLGGSQASEGDYLSGEWIRSNAEVHVGTFIAVREAGAARGIIAIDCDTTSGGIQLDCYRQADEPFTVGLWVVMPPADGFAGYHAQISWNGADSLAFNSFHSIAGTCETIAVSSGSGQLGIVCSPLVSGSSSYVGQVGEIELTCVRGAYRLDLGGTEFGVDITPTVVGARISCFPPVPDYDTGDANCDNSVSSIDAALVLQIDAGLTGGGECAAYGNVNHDGLLNSIDASLILQREAGLIANF